MEHNDDEIINKKLRTMSAVKKFNEKIALYGYKTREKELKFFEKATKFHEDFANDEDEDDIVYSNDRIVYFDNIFNDYIIENNTDQSETTIINDSTFIDAPKWTKNKKCTINPQNNDNKCFQYSVTLSLYHQEIGINSFRISKIKPFINNLNWNNINFPPQEQDYKILEINNKSIALNVLYVQSDTRKISHLYKFEFSKQEKNNQYY